MIKIIFVIFASVFAFSFFSCADILEKTTEIKLVLSPPLASANIFFNFSSPGCSERKESHTVLEAHAFAFLCRPIQEVETSPGSSIYYKGEPYQYFGMAHSPFYCEFSSESTFLDMMNTYEKFQDNDPNNEIICFTGVSNIKNSDTVTITLPPVNKGTEFFIVVYVMQKLQSGGDSLDWFTEYRFHNANYNLETGSCIPQKITASEDFQTISLTQEVPSA